MPHLENWSRLTFLGREISIGVISGHPRIKDGKFVYTSPVQSFDAEAKTAKTRDDDYTLGEPAKQE